MIEGLDGSGKSTQLRLLKEKLEHEKVPFQMLHFPRLEEGIYGRLVARFLRGEMGSIDRVDPYLVALLFAGDRADAAAMIRSWMDRGYLVIVDRYVYSNIAFQCAKLSNEAEQDALRDWILHLEFEHNLLPRPDVNLFLHVPLSFVQMQLEAGRTGDDRSYLRGAQDIHEDDLDFQERVRQVYLKLPHHVKDLRFVECMDQEGNMIPAGAISRRILEHIDL
ncbi:MAG: thymidylate kinase [Bacteroidales bacterium]